MYYYDVVGYSSSDVTSGAFLSRKASIFLVEEIMKETRKADTKKMRSEEFGSRFPKYGQHEQ
jgi:major membrane immunogen (membrane-anchored lipoprotein)